MLTKVSPYPALGTAIMVSVVSFPLIFLWDDPIQITPQRIALFAVCVALSGWAAVVSLTKNLERQWKFGNDALGLSNDEILAFKKEFVTQEIVDKRLQTLALNYHTLATQTIELEGIESAPQQLEDHKAELELAIDKFWDAKSCAMKQGYQTGMGAENYLTLPISKDEVE